jgi:hypothetical protein
MWRLSGHGAGSFDMLFAPFTRSFLVADCEGSPPEAAHLGHYSLDQRLGTCTTTTTPTYIAVLTP